MKKIILLLYVMWVTPLFAQNIIKVECYIDSDPGYGMATQVNITPSADIDTNFNVNLSGVTDGFHVLYVRTLDGNEKWSLTYSSPFYKEAYTTGMTSPNIVKAEYYLDDDPGYGSGTSISITADSLIEKSFVAGLSGIGDGFHVLYVRSLDGNGKWSLSYTNPFFKEPADSVNINAIEYFFTKGGFTSTKYSDSDFTPSRQIDVDFTASLTNIVPDTSYQMHTVVINEQGKRSLEYLHNFTVSSSSSALTAHFIISPQSGTTDTTFKFDATNSIGSGLTYRWDFDNDGTWDTDYLTTAITTHKYALIGTYTARLEVKDSNGLTNTITQSVSVPVSGASSGHFQVAYTNTGNNSTVSVQNVTIKGTAWSNNDEVGIFTPAGLCAGAGIYTGSNLAVAVWGDNDQTSSTVEGFTAGQAYVFKIWDVSAGVEYNGTATSISSLTYTANTTPVVAALSSVSIDSATTVSQKVGQDSAIGLSFSNGTSVNIQFNSGSITGKIIAIKSLGTVLPSNVVTPTQSIPVGKVVEYINLNIDTTTTFTGTIKIGYTDSILTARGIVESKLVLAYYDSTNNDWIALTTTVDTVNNIASATIRHFSYWVLGDSSSNSLLPVELNNFSYDIGSDNIVKLNWATSSETNNLGFSVERSTDKKIWDKVGFIDGNGTSTEEHIYSFRDTKVSAGTYYYRLAQTDFEGTISYSEIVTVNIALPNEFALQQNYPNPFNPTTTITYKLPEAASVKLTVYNLLGQVVRVLVNNEKQAGSYAVQWDGRNNAGLQLSSGIYIYRLQAGNFVKNMKMVLMK